MCGNNYFINCGKYLALTTWGVLFITTGNRTARRVDGISSQTTTIYPQDTHLMSDTQPKLLLLSI